MFPTFTALGTFRGQTRPWTLEVRDGTLEFWDATLDEPEQWRFAVWHPIHARDVAASARPALEHLWREALKRENVGRRIEMSDELTVFLRESDMGLARFRGPDQQVETPTRCYYFGCFEREHDTIKRFLELVALKCYQGDFGLELHRAQIPFAFNPEGELGPGVRPLHLKCARGDLQELENLSRLAWKLDPQWLGTLLRRPKVEGAGAKVIVRPDEPARVDFGYYCYDNNWGFNGFDHPRGALWKEFLRYFEPTPDPIYHGAEIQAGTRLFCLHLNPPAAGKSFDFGAASVVQPSFHQQLELRLPLRNWLRKRAGLSDERISKLLF